MILTDYTKYFQGEMAIGQLNHADVKARVEWLIKAYEMDFLCMLLGCELATELASVYSVEPPAPTPELAKLASDVKPMLAMYIYFFWENTNTTFNVGVGNVAPSVKYGGVATPSFRTTKLWNAMAIRNKQFAKSIDKATYPTYAGEPTKSNCAIYSFVNPFSL